jgi:hypothetical protein
VAENVRYGEAIGEHGLGGETTDNSGNVQQQDYGRTKEFRGPEESIQTRGTGEGSGVGA